MKLAPAGAAGVVGQARSGRRARSRSNIDRSSSRASRWPRQKWAPKPKARWSLGCRSDVEGLGVVEDGLVPVGRRVEQQHVLPGRIVSPWSSTSRVSVRAMFLMGVTQRSISSTARGSRSRSAAGRELVGMASSAYMPPLMTWRVVSSPPMRISRVS